MIARMTRSARDGWGQAIGCICVVLLVAGNRIAADEAAGPSPEQPAAAAPSPGTDASEATDESEATEASPRPEEAGDRSDEDRREHVDTDEGSVDRALRKLATIPRTHVRRPRPADQEKTAGSAQYRLPSGTRVIVIQPGSQESAPDKGAASRNPEIPRHSDGRVSEPNRLGLQHRDAIRNSVSSLPIGDDIHGQSPDWQSEIIDGEIADRNDPRLRNATAISGPYTPYRSGTQRLPTHTRKFNEYVYSDGRPRSEGLRMNVFGVDDASPAGEYYRFGFVRGSRYGQIHREADARTDRLLNSADKFRARGIAYLREGRYLQAANAFKVSAETNQHDPAARLYAAHAYFAIGRYRDAVAFLDRAFELQPKIAYLDYDLRDEYGRKADFDRHLAALEHALDRSPHDVDRLVLLGYVLCYTNQREIAWKPLIEAYRHAPQRGLVTRLLETAQPPDVELEKAGIELPDRR